MMNTDKNPKVSIIIPTYNRENLIGRTIESVLNQTYQGIEIIITDNASIDNTEKVVSKYIEPEKVLYFKNDKNLGPYPNINNALMNHASGEYFALRNALPDLVKRGIL